VAGIVDKNAPASRETRVVPSSGTVAEFPCSQGSSVSPLRGIARAHSCRYFLDSPLLQCSPRAAGADSISRRVFTESIATFGRLTGYKRNL
jgi:hypothetical protein